MVIVEIPDLDDELEDDQLDNYCKAEQGLWMLTLKIKRDLEGHEQAHEKVQKAIAKMCGDVGHPSHPRHAELQYQYCAYDGGQTHLAGKTRDAYFPSMKKTPIYWVKIIRNPEVENIERVQGPDWRAVVEDQRRI